MIALLEYMCLIWFFVQAEDGIRDLVRSRGLGDVYKRQSLKEAMIIGTAGYTAAESVDALEQQGIRPQTGNAVSYTHLTLPTSDLV
mgnify:CR=1 FL=1